MSAFILDKTLVQFDVGESVVAVAEKWFLVDKLHGLVPVLDAETGGGVGIFGRIEKDGVDGGDEFANSLLCSFRNA